MSRVSSRSGLSPSAARGSSAIDLGRDSGVDTGRKAQPSVTSGGIGVTQEVGNIGGVSITGGVSVEVSPIGISISGNPNYEDPSKSSISIAGGAEVPGGLLGIGGGVTVNTSTGEIIGGSIGGEIGGLGINVSSSEGNVGVEFTLQIPFTPIELSLGLEFPKEEPGKSTAPIVGGAGDINEPVTFPVGSDNNCEIALNSQGYTISIGGEHREWEKKIVGRHSSFSSRYPSWIMEATNTYYVRNETTGAITSYSSVTSTYTVSTNNSNRFVYNGTIIETNGNAIIGKEKNIYAYLANEMNSTYPNMWAYYWSDTREGKVKFTVADGICYLPNNQTTPPIALSPSPSPSPFPNPPPRKRNMDECCRDSVKLLRAIYKGLGIAKFPGKLPTTIIQEVAKKGEKPAEPAQVPIADFVDLLDWQFRRDDERWGQWEIQIDVKDADLTKEGDQGKSIKFPNLAESIAELEGQMLSVMANVDALVAITTKNLVESGMARQEAIKGYLAAKAIIKYMAFKSTEIDVPVPMTFTPGAETISALIIESEGHIKGTDYVEKETLRDILLDLLQAAAVIRAVHWQKIDSKTDTKSQLLNLLKGTVDLAGLISKPQKASDGEEKKFDPAQNFEDFIDSVEDGFRNTTGITDIQNPYGKTPDRRPRIRQIGLVS